MDLEQLEPWLAERGVPPEHVPGHRRAAQLLEAQSGGQALRPMHVDAAVAAAEREGATAKQLANLHKLGQTLVEFDRAQRASAAAIAANLPVPSMPPAQGETALVPGTLASPAAAGPGLEAPAATAPVQRGAGTPGWTCTSCGNASNELWYGQDVGTKLGGVSGVIAVGAGFLLGCFGAVTLFLGATSLLSGIGLVLARWRCVGCHTTIDSSALSDEQRQGLRSQRFKLGATTLFAALGGIGMFFIWMAAVAMVNS